MIRHVLLNASPYPRRDVRFVQRSSLPVAAGASSSRKNQPHAARSRFDSILMGLAKASFTEAVVGVNGPQEKDRETETKAVALAD